MGLFDKFTGGGSDAPLNKQEGFAAIMLAVMAADGDISDEEIEDYVSRLSRMRLFADMSSNQTSSMLDKLFKIKSKGGPDALVSRGVPALTPELKETAFAVAVDMIFADGSVEDAEKRLVEKLHSELGIADGLASQILDVMIIKHRG
jgi:uncharacterized tellurite resistance protein B-like protein